MDSLVEHLNFDVKSEYGFHLVSGPPRDCRVSEWSAWSACSKSCGIGEMQRRREVLKHARRGGRLCPPLVETKWCGSARSCNKEYFKF